jgi:hypothetical protein
MVVLQNCVDVSKLVPGSCSETCQMFWDGHEVMDVKVGGDTEVQEEKDPLLIHEVSFEAIILCVFVFVCVCVCVRARACVQLCKCLVELA